MSGSSVIKIGNKLVGDGQPCYIIAEIGINHNGDLDLAKRSSASPSPRAATRSSSRSARSMWSTPPRSLATPRENPFGTTNGDLKWAGVRRGGLRRDRRVLQVSQN
jgi:N-acetylneuraminate synthase